MITPFDIHSIPGLTEQEAAARLRQEGYNELPSSKQRGIFAIAAGVMREPMFLLLVACGAIYFVLGDVREALMLLGFVFVVIGITLYQERKTERALEALRDLSSPRALVIRGGRQMRIPGREVVRGDCVVLNEGDRVPADAAVLSCLNLSVDESLLTGESVPVRKTGCVEVPPLARPGGEDLPFVYSGTLVVKGQGIATVLATGSGTEIGKIGKALQSVELEKTPLQTETATIVRNLAFVGALLCAFVIVVFGMTRGDWLNGFLTGITLAMALLPEEFPVVLTIFLALGAWRISQKRVLTRRVPAVETLGAATVLCVDKTGIITQNHMSVDRMYAGGEFYAVGSRSSKSIPEQFHELAEFSILASQKDPFDPMEKAFRELGNERLARTEHLHDDWVLVREYPLSNSLMALSHVWKSPDGNEYVIAAKGSPEAIADLCHLDEDRRRGLSAAIEGMAKDGLRILGVAKSSFRIADLPPEQHDFSFEFLGLIGLADPVRPGVAEAVTECHAAGIRVVPIPGPSAVMAALSAAGLPTDRFAFEGFLPPRQGKRRARLAELVTEGRVMLFYEAPHRLAATLADMLTVLGNRQAVVARELTKIHEEFRHGSVSELIERCAAEETRGEVVILLAPAEEGEAPVQELEAILAQCLADDALSVKEAVARVTAETGLPRREVYAAALKLKNARG